MKKVCISILAILLSITMMGQDYKVKKQVVYLDKMIIGTVEGDIGILKGVRLAFLSNAGDTVFSIKDQHYVQPCPFYEDVFYYTIRFGDSGKQFMLLINKGRCLTEKCLLTQLAKDSVFTFQGSAIANQDDIIRRKDYTERFQRDTHGIRLEFDSITFAVNSSKLFRDLTKPVTISYIGKNETPFIRNEVFEFYQDDVLIADLVFRKDSLNPSQTITKYYFREKLAHQVNGKDRYLAAYGTIVYNKCMLYTFSDRKTHYIDPFSQSNGIKTIIHWLITKGYI